MDEYEPKWFDVLTQTWRTTPVEVEDNYKHYPKTIGEIRADRSGTAIDWLPRDALIDLLRKIDNGLDVTGIVISYMTIEDGDTCTHYLHTQRRNASLGLLARVMYLLNVA